MNLLMLYNLYIIDFLINFDNEWKREHLPLIAQDSV